MYITRVKKLRYRVLVFRGIAIRLMDLIGFVIGIGLICAWYFTGTNWIIGDFIYMCIFLAAIKLVKVGSLKITVIAFVFAMLLDIIFMSLAEFINGIYFNNAMLTLFNNPMFL